MKPDGASLVFRDETADPKRRIIKKILGELEMLVRLDAFDHTGWMPEFSPVQGCNRTAIGRKAPLDEIHRPARHQRHGARQPIGKNAERFLQIDRDDNSFGVGRNVEQRPSTSKNRACSCESISGRPMESVVGV